MNPVTFEALVEMAEALNTADTPWHFHMIGPQCCFSQSATQFALILENEADGQVFVCHFPDRPIAQTHQMALLCYGPNFLKKDNVPSSSPVSQENRSNLVFQAIMEKARRCCADGSAWHNHHLPPQCRLNPKKGQHCIVFEDETRRDTLYAYYEQDPVDDLAELERVLFTK